MSAFCWDCTGRCTRCAFLGWRLHPKHSWQQQIKPAHWTRVERDADPTVHMISHVYAVTYNIHTTQYSHQHVARHLNQLTAAFPMLTVPKQHAIPHLEGFKFWRLSGLRSGSLLRALTRVGMGMG